MIKRILLENWNELNESERKNYVGKLNFVYVGVGILVFYDVLENVKNSHKNNLYKILNSGKLQKIVNEEKNVMERKPFSTSLDLDLIKKIKIYSAVEGCKNNEFIENALEFFIVADNKNIDYKKLINNLFQC